MADEPEGRGTLAEGAARQLANATKTRAQWNGITPRWLIPFLPWTPVEAGIYRLNKVKETRGATSSSSADVECSPPRDRDADLPETFVDYDDNPREYFLNAVTTVLDVQTRVSDLYSHPFDQIQEQLRLLIEKVKERQESELINNKEYGLLANSAKSMRIKSAVFQGPPYRFEAGTGNIADAVGLGVAIDYLSTIGMSNIAAYEHELLGYATQGLLTVPGLRIIGTAHEKAGVISFVLDECRSEDVGKALDREGIAVRSGHHCAQPILRRFGLESTVRPSLALYNTPEDVDTLIAALHRIQTGRGKRGL